jgi:flavin-dependent trigonelline monooxygenase, oxygenase component
MVTPLMKDDREVADLTDKTKAAMAKFPDADKPEILCLRHTYVHSPEDPDGWRPAAAAINRYYRTFDAWAGNKTTPTNGFLEPSPEEKFADRPEFELDSLHKSAMIGTPDEVIERIKHYQELGVDEFAYWIDNGMTHDEKKKSLELFVQHVVPAFQEQPAAVAR